LPAPAGGRAHQSDSATLALLSTIFLGETPELFQALAFVLVVSGIVLSYPRPKAPTA
jgi:drug/metabolite transporter (DMT)-like permease